jgi:hypothetical protein
LVGSGRKLESSENLNFNMSEEWNRMQVPAAERRGGGGDEAIS